MASISAGGGHGGKKSVDSEIPLIVANPRYTQQEIQARGQHVLGDVPRQQKVTDLLLDLRAEPRRSSSPH